MDATGDTTSGYVYLETSTGVAGAEGILEIPCFDVTGTYPGLAFKYHMFGATMGTLEVRAVNGATTDVLFSISGQQQAADTSDWTEVAVPLGAYAGQSISLQIVGVRGTSFTGDIGIDEIELVEIEAFDIASLDIVSPTDDACGLSASTPVTVTVRNDGGEGISLFQLTLNVDGTNIVADLIDISPLAILPGETYDHTYTVNADLSGLGAHTITSTAFVPGDGDASNDVGTYGIINIVPSALPIDDDFESYALNEVVFMDWINRSDDDLQWDTEDGPTGSTGTGPADDASGLGGQYIYLESSVADSGLVAVLELPCVDITGTNPALTFAYHMFGLAIGELKVEITPEPSGAAATVFSLVGAQQSSETDPWQDALIPLIPYIGQTVSIRIIGSTSIEPGGTTVFTGDIALDEIEVGEVSNLDIELVNIIEPVDGCGLVAGQPVTVTIGNAGADTVTQVLMRISVDGAPITGENFAVVLPPGEDTTYTYTTTADLSALGSHFIIIETRSVGDGDLTNGIDTFEVVHIVPESLPIADDFESYGDFVTVLNDFINVDNGEIWETQTTGPTGSTGTGPIGPSEGANYLYIESSGAIDGDQAILRTPCLDLGSGVNPQLSFDYHMWGSSIDFLEVNLKSGGMTVNLFSAIGEQDTSDTDPWNTAVIDLSPFIGNVVEIEFIGAVLADSTNTTFRGDIALDDIRIVDPLPNDVGATMILSGSCDPTIEVEVENFGTNTVTQIAMTYSINGGTPVTEPFATSLAAGATTVYTFSTPGVFSGGLNTLDASASVFPTDDNTSNDAAPQLSINVVADGFIEDFDAFAEAETEFSFAENTGILNWETEAGTTTSTATGPSVDAGGSATGIYIYMETSSPAVAGDFATLELCADLAGMTNASVTYAYHMFGDAIKDLVVSVDDGSGFVAVGGIVGQQQLATTDPWGRDTVDLSAYDGQQVTIAFTGTIDTVGTAFNADISIDEIGISEGSGPVGCNAATPPSGMTATVGATAVALTWNPVAGSVGCQVNGGPLGIFGATQNIPGPAVSGINFPLAILPPNTYNARVRCACQISPSIVVTPYSSVVVFTVPEPRVGNFTAVQISPNPATNYLNLNFSSVEGSEEILQVVDLLGRVLHSENIQVSEGVNTFTIDLNTLDNGAYFLQIGTGENQTVKQFDVLK